MLQNYEILRLFGKRVRLKKDDVSSFCPIFQMDSFYSFEVLGIIGYHD